nr:10109_t:CDS:2 [Entrophospora candida]
MTEFGNDVLSCDDTRRQIFGLSIVTDAVSVSILVTKPTIQWNGVNDYDFDQDGCAGWIQEEKPYLLLRMMWIEEN